MNGASVAENELDLSITDTSLEAWHIFQAKTCKQAPDSVVKATCAQVA